MAQLILVSRISCVLTLSHYVPVSGLFGLSPILGNGLELIRPADPYQVSGICTRCRGLVHFNNTAPPAPCALQLYMTSGPSRELRSVRTLQTAKRDAASQWGRLLTIVRHRLGGGGVSGHDRECTTTSTLRAKGGSPRRRNSLIASFVLLSSLEARACSLCHHRAQLELVRTTPVAAAAFRSDTAFKLHEEVMHACSGARCNDRGTRRRLAGSAPEQGGLAAADVRVRGDRSWWNRGFQL